MLTFIRKNLWLVIGLIALSLAASSFVLTALLDLHPCYLCIFQRLLFMLIGVFALLAVTGFGEKVWGGLVLLLAGVGTATATYQTWLQLQPPGEVSCAGGQPNLIEQLVYFLSDHVPALFEVTGLCEDEELVILGLSLANWALVSFLSAFVAAAWALFRKQNRADQV
ncbi:disulfide bond formation protein B [Thiothrix lacustris]|jgi:disulfide bond formation protein DsbB|uniref:Disulfide bond formation protein B n=1 Tax=Thiothrix lacustris TaxID=525917 RepID=A0ABY9MU31_9GAMM|nr:disulfide bond formation protein B [Thiothrix lacustris]WML92179.1 disulfide bond formation protein B [Thiothrix lacustris]WMP19105.1 disulfide bond formation protein B [Thiothrix lacustris]